MEQGYEVVTSGKELAERITARGRTKPAAVISWHPRMPQNRIDVEHVAREVGGLAEIYYLENGPESFSFGDALPYMANVYGNAARVYPTDLRWMEDVYRSPLRMAVSPETAARAADAIIEDVFGLVTTVVPSQPATRPSMSRHASGVIKAFASAGSRAIVELEDGTRCSIQREHVIPPVRLDWMLAAGQPVEGEFNDEDKTLNISALKVVPRLAALYRPGDLVLALAEKVTVAEAVLTLYPGFSRTVTATGISSNPLDTVDSLISEGEVVVARLLHDRGAVVLSLVDVDDDTDVKEAPTLLAGGTPWLRPGRHLTVRSTSASAPDAGAVAVGPETKSSTALMSAQLQLESERRKVASLQEQLSVVGQSGAGVVANERGQDAWRRDLESARQDADRAHAELEAATARLDRQAEQLRNQRTLYRHARQSLSRAGEDPADWFETEEERLHHDIYLTWARNTPASDKGRLPLPSNWQAGPEFVESLNSFKEPGGRSKALKAAVEVLTGAADCNAAREVHALRSSTGGDTPPLRRPDGARCFRAAIERNVAAARRLHYWKLPNGAVEFSRVVVHDDFKP